MLSRVGNVVAFQIGWFTCVWGAGSGRSWLGPVVVLGFLSAHLWLTSHRRHLLGVVLTVGLIGIFLDSTLGYLGILVFRDSPLSTWFCPPWLIALWFIFATTLTNALSWLSGRDGWAAVLGGSVGPVSYYAGSRLGALELGSNLWVNLGVLAAVWAVLLPVLMRVATGLANWSDGDHPTTL